MVAVGAKAPFRLLGELEVEGVPRRLLGGPKQRALLAYLLLHANELVPRDRLVDAVWGESAPPTARSIVHGYVRKLRAALEGTGATIEARSPGYVLELDVSELDVRRFERLVTEGRARLVGGDPEHAHTLLTEGLALWRGEPLADLAYEPAVEAEARRLEELRLEATMDRIEAELALGGNGYLVGELESLVSKHPFAERLRGQLMVALYRAGRQADALDAYQAARHTLTEELGIDPGPNLRRLEDAILRHDPALAVVASREEPPAPRPTRRPVLLVALIAFVVVGAAAALVTRTRSTPVLVAPNSLAVIDPATNELVDSVAVGIRPGPVAAAPTGVWVANLDDRTLQRIDARRRKVVRTIPLPDLVPTGLAVGDGAVWVGDGTRGILARVSTMLVRVASTTPVGCLTRAPAAPASVAVGEGAVWFVCGATLARVEPPANHVTSSDYRALGASAIAAGLGAVWVANAGENTVSKVDPATGTTRRTLNVAAEPGALVLGKDAVWVAAARGDAVSRLRIAGPGLPISSESIAVGDAPSAVAVGEGAVWVANGGDGTVSRIDPRTRRVVATVEVGNRPAGIAVGGGLVWVAVQAKDAAGLK